MQPEEDTTIEQEKLKLQQDKQANDKNLKDKDLRLKEKQLGETKRHNIATEKISKISKQTKPSK